MESDTIRRSFPIRVIRLQNMQLVGHEEIISLVRRDVRKALFDSVEELLHLAEDDEERALQFAIDIAENVARNGARFAILSHQWGHDEITMPSFNRLSKITSDGVQDLENKYDHLDGFSTDEVIDLLLEHSTKATAKWPPNNRPLIHALDNLLLKHSTDIVWSDKRAMDNLLSNNSPSSMLGSSIRKLVRFCYLAEHSFGCKFAWIDTCCIDKTSSAELDESIRSMFKWYRDSAICLVYLPMTFHQNVLDKKFLPADEWFYRGWTLQELLAPKVIKFYCSNWEPVTTLRNDKVANPYPEPKERSQTIMNIISDSICHIPMADLLDFKPGLKNIRDRLRWASSRDTTRIEDQAYCLLGIFDINMPIAYGEGENAFHRLQAAIMEQSNDRNLFLWNGRPSKKLSMFAIGPECFSSETYEIIHTDVQQSSSSNLTFDPTYTLTNFGIRISMSLYNQNATFEYFKWCRMSEDTTGPDIARWDDVEHDLKTWMVKTLSGDHPSEDDFDQDDAEPVHKIDFKEYRLAVLGYTRSLQPVLILLVKCRKGNVVYYRRHPWRARFEGSARPGLSELGAPNDPEVIYIR